MLKVCGFGLFCGLGFKVHVGVEFEIVFCALVMQGKRAG